MNQVLKYLTLGTKISDFRGTEISNEHQVRGTGGACKETENTKANTSECVSIRQHSSKRILRRINAPADEKRVREKSRENNSEIENSEIEN